MSRLKLFWKERILTSVVFPWVVLFLLTNLIVTQDGGQNALSRWAALRAMVESKTLSIDHYQDWSGDWSYSNDGHYYSNKAPGPVLLAYPLFFVLDNINRISEKGPPDAKGRRNQPAYMPKTVVSMLLQAVPYSLFTILICSYLVGIGASLWAVHFTAIALLFGNIASFMMNNFHGHGMVSWFTLAYIYFFLKRRYALVGLFYGLSLLSDYSASLFLLPLLAIILWRERKNLQWLPAFLVGGFFPGMLWSWYHTATFGGILEIASKYQNPVFNDMKNVEGNLWGALTPIPRLEILEKLLIGGERGILFTQPWALLLPIAFLLSMGIPGRRKLLNEHLPILTFTFVSFILLLWMNASFGGWHGGGTPGPRYMSAIFPLMGFSLGLAYKSFSLPEKALLWIGLLGSLAFKAVAWPSTIIVPAAEPIRPLWDFYLSDLANSNTRKLRLAIFLILFVGTTVWVIRRKVTKPSLKKLETEPLSAEAALLN